MPGRSVPDPYSGGADDFEQVLDLIEQGCADRLAKIFYEGGEPRPPILD
jgi:protein-tyrosine-phosphatase